MKNSYRMTAAAYKKRQYKLVTEWIDMAAATNHVARNFDRRGDLMKLIDGMTGPQLHLITILMAGSYNHGCESTRKHQAELKKIIKGDK